MKNVKIQKKINISAALINNENRYLLQLRDFNAEIAYPGCWGLFGGHLEDEEDSFCGLKRELIEELEYVITTSEFLGNVETNLHNINLYLVDWDGDYKAFTQKEGSDLSDFKIEDIFTGKLYSRLYKENFPVTPGCYACFQHFVKIK